MLRISWQSSSREYKQRRINWQERQYLSAHHKMQSKIQRSKQFRPATQAIVAFSYSSFVQIQGHHLRSAQSILFTTPRPSPQTPPCALTSNTPEASQNHFAALQTQISTQGYKLQDQSIGPFLRLNLKEKTTSKTLAKISGALLPASCLHIETYKTTQPFACKALLSLTPAMIIFIATLAIASDQGCTSVYGLAIRDAPDQHQRLVRYLRRFGGKPIQTVDNNLSSLPARIFYGGLGTVIKGDVPYMLQRGLAIIKRNDAQ